MITATIQPQLLAELQQANLKIRNFIMCVDSRARILHITRSHTVRIQVDFQTHNI